MTAMITVTLNGEPRTFDAPLYVDRLVAAVAGTGSRDGIAVARNGEVVRRVAWQNTVVCDGDAIELVRAIQGG